MEKTVILNSVIYMDRVSGNKISIKLPSKGLLLQEYDVRAADKWAIVLIKTSVDTFLLETTSADYT